MRQTRVQRVRRLASYSVTAGFTLVELLIAIGIIGLLISLSIPAIQASRESARRTQCVNNQRQYGVAFTNFESQNKTFPSWMTAQIKGPLANAEWQVFDYVADLLPFLEESSVANSYHRDDVFCSPRNLQAIAAPLNVAVCPSAPRSEYSQTPSFHYVPSLCFSSDTRAHPIAGPILASADKKYTTTYTGAVTDYSVPSGATAKLAKVFGYDAPQGLTSMFPPIAVVGKELESNLLAVVLGTAVARFEGKIRVAQISDGMSHTFVLTEVSGRPEHWTRQGRTPAGEPLPAAWADPKTVFSISGAAGPNGTCLLQCDNHDEIFSFHSNGANFLFADGHVAFIEENIEGRLLLGLMTPNQNDDHNLSAE